MFVGQFNINKFYSVEIHINVKNLTQRYNLELVLWIVFKESWMYCLDCNSEKSFGKQRVQDSVFFWRGWGDTRARNVSILSFWRET